MADSFHEHAFRISELGGLFAWLLDMGVTSERIGGLLGTTAGNVRITASRYRKKRDAQDWPAAPLAEVPDADDRKALGIRSHEDAVVNNRKRETSLDELKQRFDCIVTNTRREHRYESGIAELRGLLRVIGYIAASRRIALRASIHDQLAWFHCQLGRSASAIQETRRSVGLWRVAYHETHRPADQREYAIGYARATLAGANAALIGQMPSVAWDLLQTGQSAAESVGEPPGSDHLRQCGVACFQLRQDDLARSFFEQAGQAMHDIRDAWTPATPLLASDRHRSLIGTPDWDKTLEVRNAVGKYFGESSLQFSMASTWAAAAGLSTDSSPLHQSSRELLEDNAALAARFDHQATVTRLLSITSELGLYPRLQGLYVRRALYENISRRF